ncbi:MAG TPA: TMEM175 family protein [Solirubrobacteraceae bacterium]|nr:TMEM175 family protein [Solirubrobacteraceae bacterium]
MLERADRGISATTSGTNDPIRRSTEPAAGGLVLSSSRLETFSDGVFAIAITLLVLDLTIDAARGNHLLRALLDLWPSYLAYLTSFSIVGLVWMGHHVILSLSMRVDRRLLKINLALLLVVAFLPFPTRLLTEFISDPRAERVAAVFYGVWLLVISVALAGMWRYTSANNRLLRDDFSQARIDHITRIFQPNIALYAVGIALGLILPQIAAGLYLVIAVVGFIRTA